MKKTMYGLPLMMLATSAIADVSGSGYISHVTDGDTYWITAHHKHEYQGIMGIDRLKKGAVKPLNKAFKTRILNIDTAESVHPDGSRNSAGGKNISRLLKDELTGVQVNYRCKDEAGYYGRPLCSVYRADNGNDIAIELIGRNFTDYVTKYGRHPWNHAGYASAELKRQREHDGGGHGAGRAFIDKGVEISGEITVDMGKQLLKKLF